MTDTKLLDEAVRRATTTLGDRVLWKYMDSQRYFWAHFIAGLDDVFEIAIRREYHLLKAKSE